MYKILVIEDEKVLRENIAEVLSFEGYEVFTAENGKKGINLALQFLPDLIVCDIMMPDMDGYQVLLKIKSNENLPPIPFVFLTALSERKDLRLGMDMGADDYITKPFAIKELLRAISSRLEKYQSIEKSLLQSLGNTEKELSKNIQIKEQQIEDSTSGAKNLSKENTPPAEKNSKSADKLQDSLDLIEITNTLESLLKTIDDELSGSEISEDKRNFLLKFKSKITNPKNLKNNWTIFSLKFNQQYPDFVSKILRNAPALTQYEITLLSALAMNMNTSQIAGLMNIDEGSVRKSKYRLKKKLNLHENDDLINFIQKATRNHK